MSRKTSVYKPTPAVPKPKTTAHKPNTTAWQQGITTWIIRGAFRVPGAASGCLLGVPGAPLGCLLGSLGDPWGTFGATFGAKRATIAHGPKTEQAQKKKQPPPPLGHFWFQNGSPGCPNEVKKWFFFDLKCVSKFKHFLGTYFNRKSVYF